MSDESNLARAGQARVDPISQRRPIEPARPIDSGREQEQSLKAIVSDLWQHSEKLVKAELELGLELGKAELDRHVEEAKLTVRRTAIMSGFFYAAYLMFLTALVLGLSKVLPPWLVATAVGIASALGGYVMLQATKKSARDAVTPMADTRNQQRRHDAIPNQASSRAHN